MALFKASRADAEEWASYPNDSALLVRWGPMHMSNCQREAPQVNLDVAAWKTIKSMVFSVGVLPACQCALLFEEFSQVYQMA